MHASMQLGCMQRPIPAHGARNRLKLPQDAAATESQRCGRRISTGRRAPPDPRQQARTLRSAACAAAADAPGGLAERPKLVPDNWQRILEVQATGEVVETVVEEVNKGGVIVDVRGIKGFIPFSKLDPGHLGGEDSSEKAEGSLDQVSMSLDDDRRNGLVGKPIIAKVIQVDVPNRSLVLSERAAYMSKLVQRLEVGDVVTARVHRLMDFGAFVYIQDENGDLHGEALIAKNQLSWDVVMRPEQVVNVGDIVKARVSYIDQKNARVNLSLKQMTEDPLKETLDGVLPAVGPDAQALGTAPTSVPQSIEEVVAELGKEDGIDNISMGRQVEEQRTVAQDLEIYIRSQQVEGGYALVARAGRIVQEINITTTLGPPGLKAAMQRALKRLV